MRLFFGLQIEQQACLDIDHWLTTSLPPMAHPVPLANFHITLVFMGKVDSRHHERLTLAADEIHCPKFDLLLNEVGFWNKTNIFCLGPSETPTPLLSLSAKLKNLANQMGSRTEKHHYQPHVTLARRCELPPPAAIEPPEFHLVFDQFNLYESVTTRSGIRYDVVNSWALE
jgi:2'-5' RNA ligase